ncbi:MAG: hypothetical protein ACUVXB_15190 [Bryobacteraceae bacterium]
MSGQGLDWVPGSLYVLRDHWLAGHLTEVSPGRLRGYVILRSKLRTVNGEIRYEPQEIQQGCEWDLEGNALADRSLDLMELIRP